MNLSSTSFKKRGERAWALLAVLTLSAAALMTLAGVMAWANVCNTTTGRNNEYVAACYAAEGATEKALASISQQYQNYGFSLLGTNTTYYQTNIPNSSDDPFWTNYAFSGGTTANQIIFTNMTSVTNQFTTNSAYASYAGLTMTGSNYEIIANARNISGQYGIVATVGQEIQLGTVPLFQFAIFYEGTMEIDPGAAMTISGPVHGNSNIYLQPQALLTFSNNITSTGNIYLTNNPLDPTQRTSGTNDYLFDGAQLSDQPPLNVPVGTNMTGTNASGQNVYGILEPPTTGQTPSSSTGSNLLYNQVDMIIIISNNNQISVTSGAGINNQATVISNSAYSSWLSTNGTFTDLRDNLTVNPIVINVSNLVQWSATNTTLSSALSSVRGSSQNNVQSIYIDDQRGTSNATVTTNYTYGTNYSTNQYTCTGGVSCFPASGTYAPPIISTNVTGETNSSRPSSGPPATYLGTITNLVTETTNHTVTTNGSGSHKTYTTNTTYTYSTNYAYALINGYTYNAITATGYTNISYLTNWNITSQPGIVLSNGAILPPQGLSVATPDPAYVVGNWNVQTNKGGTSDAGSNSTAYTYPSAIYADAITVLSSAWNPANSASSNINNRDATSDTVNAAFLTGNVPSDGNTYSGGVENFPRFLENWSGQTFTYNGSMVCMFNSQIADYPWPGTGTVYNPPTRNWAFDNNFNNPAKQPPLTPHIRTVVRGAWVLLAPNTPSF